MSQKELDLLQQAQADVFAITDQHIDEVATMDAVEKRRLNELNAKQAGASKLDIWRAKVNGQKKVSTEA